MAAQAVPVYYSAAYAGAAFAFETTRKAQWVAQSLHDDPIAGLELRMPQPLTWEQMAQVHTRAYVQAVRTGEPRALAESQSLDWDPCLGPMVLATNGGAVAAALDALRHRAVAGSLSSGLHHARGGGGLGYCTFNGLVLAARAALEAGARTVLILDLDAHCGGGTAELVAHEPRIWQLDVSVDDFDHYTGTPQLRLHMVSDSSRYLSTVRAGLQAMLHDAPRFDLCLYNAGMDPHQDSGDGALAGIDATVLQEREAMVFDWCRANAIPVAFVLAGGYVSERLDQQALVALHRLTLTAAAGLRA
ncbi:MAG: hypothetical protein ABIR55_07985 [Burkholderiaceae bacterium]